MPELSLRIAHACSRTTSLPEGVLVASSLNAAFRMCDKLAQNGAVETLYVIGGSQLYAEALDNPRTSAVYLTRVDITTECDAFFPDLTSKERFVLKTTSGTREENGIKYHFESYAAEKQMMTGAASSAPLPLHADVANLSSLVDVRWSTSRGKAVFSTQDIDPGVILWREHAVAAMQYAENRQSGAMACRDSLRFVGTLGSQLQVLGQFSESEQTAGMAHIEPELIELMSRSKAAARCSGTFELEISKDSSEELFADAGARKHAFSAYNRWLKSDPAAWVAFQEHALATNETFMLAAQLLARYFCSQTDNSGTSQNAETCGSNSRRPVDVLEGLISALWWELSPASGAAAQPGREDPDQDCEDEDVSTLDVATSRRVLLKQSYELLVAVARAAGSEVTIEMYSRLIGALELNSIAVEVQSPLAALLDELVELGDEANAAPALNPSPTRSGGDAGTSTAPVAEAATGVHVQDVERTAQLILPHVERRLELHKAANSQDNAAHTKTGQADNLPQPAADLNPKRRRLDAEQSNTAGQELSCTPIIRLREIIAEVGRVDQLYPPLSGVGLYDGVAMLNHDCEPNAVVVFEQDATAAVAALRPIRKGEEICISYIEVDQNVHERRADLLDYGFVCSCSRCVTQMQVET